MKQFAIFVQKEFFHILRDKRTMLIMLGIPIVQIILFGFAISTEVKNVRTAVYAPTNDGAVGDIVRKIGASNYFTITQMLSSPTEIESVFRQNRADLVVVFEEGFEQNLHHTGNASVQLVADSSDPNTATMLVAYATNIIGDYQREKMVEGGVPIQIIPNVKLLHNPQMKSAYNFVPGVMGLILMIICAMMTSISIVREKERGTMEVLLVSPIKPIFIITSKLIPYLCISLVNLVTILLLSIFVLDVPVSGSFALLFLVSLIFISVALALGLLISTLVNSQVVAMLISGMVLLMPTVFLSGMVFSVANMPTVLQWFSYITPAQWYIAAVKKVMIEGLGFRYVAKEIVILLAMCVVLIGISLKKFKYRLE